MGAVGELEGRTKEGEMTTRYNALLVVLDENVREDDAAGLMAAIACLRGVTSVEGNAADLVGDAVARRRCDRRWVERLGALIDDMVRL